MANALAIFSGRGADHWRGKAGELTDKAAKAAGRLDAIRAERRGLALEAHEGDEVAQKRLKKLAADEGAAELALRDTHAALETVNGRLAEAEAKEAAQAKAQRRAERDAILMARLENAREAEKLIAELGTVVVEMHEQAVTARQMSSRSTSDLLYDEVAVFKFFHRVMLALWRAKIVRKCPDVWRGEGQPGFADGEVRAQALAFPTDREVK